MKRRRYRGIERISGKITPDRARALVRKHFNQTSWHSLSERRIKTRLFLINKEKKTHKDEVRLLHGPSGRRRASLFFVRCATFVEAIPFLRAPNSARSASYRQRCSTCHRVQAVPSNEGRIEESVQPFFEDRSRSSVSLFTFTYVTLAFHPSSRCGLHIATKNRIPSRIPRDGINAFFLTFSSTATFDSNDSALRRHDCERTNSTK